MTHMHTHGFFQTRENVTIGEWTILNWRLVVTKRWPHGLGKL